MTKFHCRHKRLIEGKAGIEAVLCPGCGDPIRVLVPTDELTSRTIGHQIHHYHKMELICLPRYREVHLECSMDGILSKHVASMCEQCALGATLEDHQAVHDADMVRDKCDDLLKARTVERVIDVNLGGVP